MGNEGGVAAPFDPVAGLFDEFDRSVVGDFDEEQLRFAEGERVVQQLGKVFVQVVFGSGDKLQGDRFCGNLHLELLCPLPDSGSAAFVGPLDQVRGAADCGESGGAEGPRHRDRFLQGGGAVVDSGKEVAVVVGGEAR